MRKNSVKAIRAVSAIALASAFGITASVVAPATDAEAVIATPGAGTSDFAQMIDWVTWGQDGEQVTGDSKVVESERVFDADTKVVTTCTIDNFEFRTDSAYPFTINAGSLLRDGSRATSDTAATRKLGVTALQAYQPGNFYGDGFPVLYGQPSGNGEVVGLRSGTNPTNVTSFDLACSAILKVTGQADTVVPVAGLVVADAESLKNNYLFDEFIEMTALEYNDKTNPKVDWRVIDAYRSDVNTNDRSPNRAPSAIVNDEFATLSADGNTARLSAQNEDESRMKAATLYAEGANKVRVTMGGAGATGIAVGSIAEIDFGDAPATYGVAGALLSGAVTGGTLTPGVKTNLTDGTYAAGSIEAPGANYTGPTTLGSNFTVDRQTMFNDFAKLDAADDALTGIDVIRLPIDSSQGTTLDVTLSCIAPGNVRGWIDFDENGTFDAAEASTEVACDNGSAVVTFNVPAATKSSAKTFLRFRISTNSGLTPTGVSSNGEVEDYALPVIVTRDAQTTGMQGATQNSDDKDAADYGQTPEEMFPGLSDIDPDAKFSFDGDQTTLTVAGVGTYEIDPATGEVTFTPEKTFVGTAPAVNVHAKAKNFEGIAEADLVAAYTAIVLPTSAVVTPGENLNNISGTTVSVTPQLDTDGATPDDPRIDIATLKFDAIDKQDAKLANAVLSADGKKLAVPGEGVWTISANGVFTFTPESGFTGNPTPVSYSALDTNGAPALNSALITITYLAPMQVPVTAVTEPVKLAFTGGNAMPFIAGGVLALVAAAGALAIARRKQES